MQYVIKLKVYEAFAGKGTFSSAMKEIGVPIEIVGYCEIDKYASTAFSAIHNIDEDMNDWDISKINTKQLPDFDVFTHGSPCTSYSSAGKRDGGDKGSGTESSLMWYSVDIIEHKKPKYILWENVSAVLQNKHKHNFDQYISDLNDIGYNSYWKVINALDSGIPQTRERIYVVSIRKDIDDGTFMFPEYNYRETMKSLKSELESDAEPPIYHNIYGGFGETKPRVFENYSPTIRTAKGGGHIPSVKLKTILEDNVDPKYQLSQNYLNYISEKESKNYNFRVAINSPEEVLKTPLRAKGDKAVVNDGTKRFLTPLECWRLMDESDENFYKVKAALIEKFYHGKDRANSQLYKIAGNSIVKRVLEIYMEQLFKNYINLQNNKFQKPIDKSKNCDIISM